MTPEADMPEQQPETMSPGLMLRIARKQTGLSLEEAARAANLTQSIARALEQDEYGALGLPVYARGYYRRYARVVQCDVPAVVGAYEAINDIPTAVPQIAQRPSIPYGARSPLQKILPGLVFVGLAAVLVWSFAGKRKDNSTDIPADAVPLASAQVTPEPLSVTPSLEPLPDLSAARTPHTVDMQAPTSASSSPAITAAEGGNRPAEAAGSLVPPNLLEIQLGPEPAWIEVLDAAANRLAYRIAEAGESLRLEGDPPYRINLGRAYSLSVRYGGRELDLRPVIDSASRARGTITANGELRGS